MNLLGGFFDNESAFGRVMTMLGTLVVCNLMFVVCTIPVITIGSGWSALCYTFLRLSYREGAVKPVSEFIEGFRRNFKKATIYWLLILFIFLFLALDWYWCTQLGGFFLKIRFGLALIAICVFIIAIYIFPVLTVFPGKLSELIQYCIYFAFHKPVKLIVLSAVTIVPFVLTYSFLDYYPLAAFLWFFAGFAVIAKVSAKLLLSEFKPFLDRGKEELKEQTG
nr:YesL family protein [Lachnospiraceae bacterium]